MATNEPDNTNHNISESADKIRLETKVKRGTKTKSRSKSKATNPAKRQRS